MSKVYIRFQTKKAQEPYRVAPPPPSTGHFLHIVQSIQYKCACLDFLKVVRLVFWSGVVGPGTNFRSLALRARTIALRAHSRATRSKARLVSKSSACQKPES